MRARGNPQPYRCMPTAYALRDLWILGSELPYRRRPIPASSAPGALVARVANPAKLKAAIKISETQARDVQLDQPVEIDTRNGVIPGHVIRIDPAVENGTVTVDVALDGPLPRGARPDLSVDGTVQLERLQDVLHLARPVQAQPDSTVGLFKVVDGGKGAVRVAVNQDMATAETRIQAGDEVAFFPPVTGG